MMCLSLSQPLKLAKSVVFGKAGFLALGQFSTDIYEWDHSEEKFVLSPLVQNGRRDTAAVMGISRDLLGC